VFPRVTQNSRVLSFAAIRSPDELVAGPWNLLEPGKECPEVTLQEIGVFVVPGLGFDRRGARVGWGGGYYDATLPQSSGIRVGFAYDCQILEEIPETSRDARMHHIVTESKTLDCLPLPSPPPWIP